MTRKSKRFNANYLYTERIVHTTAAPGAGTDSVYYNLTGDIAGGGYTSFQNWMNALVGEHNRARLRKLLGKLVLEANFSVPATGNWWLVLINSTEVPASVVASNNRTSLEEILDDTFTDEFVYEVLGNGLIGPDRQLIADTIAGLTQTFYFNRTIDVDIDFMAKLKGKGVLSDSHLDYPEFKTFLVLVTECKDNQGTSWRVDGNVTTEYELLEQNKISDLLEGNLR